MRLAERFLNHVRRAAFCPKIGRELSVGDGQKVGTKALEQFPHRIIRAANHHAAHISGFGFLIASVQRRVVPAHGRTRFPPDWQPRLTASTEPYGGPS